LVTIPTPSEFIAGNSQEAIERADRAIEEGERVIIFDLSVTKNIDSIALQLLTALRKRASSVNAIILLEAPSDEMLLFFQAVKFDELFFIRKRTVPTLRLER
jgi:anti-anti-sigma regulatory factor